MFQSGKDYLNNNTTGTPSSGHHVKENMSENSTGSGPNSGINRELFKDRQLNENFFANTTCGPVLQSLRVLPVYRDVPRIQRTKELPGAPDSIHCTTVNNKVWVHLDHHNSLQLVTVDKGQKLEQVNLTQKFEGIAVESETGAIVGYNRNQVSEINIENGNVQIRELFNCSSPLCCIAITKDKTILAGFQKSKLVNRLSENGTILKSYILNQCANQIVVDNKTERAAILLDNQVITLDENLETIKFQEKFHDEKVYAAVFDSRCDMLVSTGNRIHVLSYYGGRRERTIELGGISSIPFVECMALIERDLLWIGNKKDKFVKLLCYKDIPDGITFQVK